MKPSGESKIRTTKRISVFITPEALQKAKLLVATFSTECQWYHLITKEITNTEIIYTLSDCIVPEQFVTGATVDTSPNQMYELVQSLMSDRNLDMMAAGAIVNKMHCWCHSHVTMASQPSGTDDKQWQDQKVQALSSRITSPQAMIILNKRNEYFLRISDPELNLELENQEIQLKEPAMDLSEFLIQARNKIKQRPLVTQSFAGNTELRKFVERTQSNSEATYSWLSESKNKSKKIHKNSNRDTLPKLLQGLEDKILQSDNESYREKCFELYTDHLKQSLGPEGLLVYTLLYSKYDKMISCNQIQEQLDKSTDIESLAGAEDVLMEVILDGSEDPIWMGRADASYQTAKVAIRLLAQTLDEELCDAILTDWVEALNINSVPWGQFS